MIPKPLSLYSRLRAQLLQQRLNVAETKRERLLPAGIADDLRHMVGHDHALVADVAVRSQSAGHIHVAVVRKGLLKSQEAAADVAKVHVENLSPAAEIADHVVDFLARFFEHLRNGALA